MKVDNKNSLKINIINVHHMKKHRKSLEYTDHPFWTTPRIWKLQFYRLDRPRSRTDSEGKITFNRMLVVKVPGTNKWYIVKHFGKYNYEPEMEYMIKRKQLNKQQTLIEMNQWINAYPSTFVRADEFEVDPIDPFTAGLAKSPCVRNPAWPELQ